jgi:hypothetical protein
MPDLIRFVAHGPVMVPERSGDAARRPAAVRERGIRAVRRRGAR